jgi:hypothetical protein
MRRHSKTIITVWLVFALWLAVPATAAEWQWSVPNGEGRAYLWIPPSCRQVRAVVVANHNMIEQGILEHPTMRRTLSDLGFAEMWVVPGMDIKFDFNNGAGEAFEQLIGALAQESGYDELRTAPVVTLGHSANATWPWNFAAWNPNRTLAVLSVHGDGPQTTLTGYGRANVDWGNRNIDGVPGLMVMGEYEWGEPRLAPALAFRAKYPNAPLAFLADAGHGHFDYSDELVAYLAMFIRKATKFRLPLRGSIALRPIDPKKGWLIDRWRKDKPPLAPSAPYAKYKGDLQQACWGFDREMAWATERYYAAARGKKPQLLSITDGETPVEKGSGEPVTPRAILWSDGLTFRLKTEFVEVVPKDNGKAAFWTGLTPGNFIGHSSNGPIRLSKIVGPAVQIAPDTLKIALGRAQYTPDRRNNDVWIWAHHPGDKRYKSIVQQAKVRLTPNREGVEQHLTFPVIPDQKVGTKTLKLGATSDPGLPVSYFVVSGPVEVEGDTLRFTPIPPRAKFPVKVIVVAWQWGRSVEPKVQAAAPVTREFIITRDHA